METGIVYGRVPVLEYLRAGLILKDTQLYIQQNAHGTVIEDIKKLASKQKLKVRQVDKNFFKKNYSDEENDQGVELDRVALYRGFNDKLIDEAVQQKKAILILDQITDNHNAGAIIRSAEAFGIAGVIAPQNNSFRINPTVIKSSAGATAHVPISFEKNLSRTIDILKDKGFWIIGTSDRGSDELSKVSDMAPCCIIIGSEGKGMRQLTEKKCDLTVQIPLKGKTSSLNASVAAGILLYETTKNQQLHK